MRITRPQREALYRLYQRQYKGPNGWSLFKPSYMKFRRSAHRAFGDCVMKDMGWAVVGIEADGYTHT
tara:strand:- start:763 stop:963 length:201 start_codon:yes stop_codon:yes gene_type:complete